MRNKVYEITSWYKESLKVYSNWNYLKNQMISELKSKSMP